MDWRLELEKLHELKEQFVRAFRGVSVSSLKSFTVSEYIDLQSSVAWRLSGCTKTIAFSMTVPLVESRIIIAFFSE